MILIFRLIPEELEYPELRESDEYMIISYRFCIVQVDSLQHVVARAAHYSANPNRDFLIFKTVEQNNFSHQKIRFASCALRSLL
jgi:hypothetical protein